MIPAKRLPNSTSKNKAVCLPRIPGLENHLFFCHELSICFKNIFSIESILMVVLECTHIFNTKSSAIKQVFWEKRHNSNVKVCCTFFLLNGILWFLLKHFKYTR